MTLDTRIYLHDRADYREVFAKCCQLIGADEGTRFRDEPGNIWNEPGQGLCALLDVRHGDDGEMLVKPGERFTPCGVPCWIEVSFDTAYGYHGPEGGCGDLHARLVAEFGRWLDGKGIRWSWRNEFTGEVHQGYEGLAELGEGGLKALDWFATQVVPAIRATGGEIA